MEQGLYAGFAKVDITPDYVVGLSGYSNPESRRNEDGIADRIYTTCIALTEGEETILLYTVDTCGLGHEFAEAIRKVVSKAVEIPAEKIFCAATHTHNAPALFGYPEVEMYAKQLHHACARAAQLALEDRAPAKTWAVKKKFEKMNFVRHVKLANGIAAGYNWRSFNSPIVGFSGEADHEMVIVKFAREEKKDIVLINWQGHPDCSNQIGKLYISPSYPGPLRDTVEAGSGALVAYFTGADGDMIIDSMIPEYKHNLGYRRYAVRMANLALEAMEEMVEVEGEGIDTRRRMIEVDVDHSWDHMLKEANEVYDLWKSTDKPTGDALGKKYNFSSVYQARAIRTRAQMGKSIELETNAFRVGGVGFTTGTYEMFGESGIQVKEGSPYEFTFLLTGNSSYIPSDIAFNHRCYEADTGLYARGAAEKLVENYVNMLKEIKE